MTKTLAGNAAAAITFFHPGEQDLRFFATSGHNLCGKFFGN